MPALTECLQTDHRRLDAIFAECKSLAGAGGFAAAADRFATFVRGLGHHIDAEEDVLFPALAEHAPHAEGPMSVMRAEHTRIRELMAALTTAFSASQPAWRPLAAELEEVLSGHNMKEERILYPMADEATSGAPDVDSLQTRIRGMLG